MSEENNNEVVIKENSVEEPAYDLFKSEALQSALKSLTPAQREQYRQMGEYMYGDLKFEDKINMNKVAPPMEEAAVYIAEGLKSGLHPSYLDENEVAVLQEVYGEDWYTNWGYTKEDLEEEEENTEEEKSGGSK